MVAVMSFGSSIRRILTYNEQKVSEGKAVCLQAVNFPLEADEMSADQKLFLLRNQAGLNSRAKVNSVHISLNFDPSEQLSEKLLREIAGQYMERIGFGGQPYLLYQHHDAGHPHCHLVSTNIRSDGSRISLHNLGKVQSEAARKALEAEYNLVRAEDQKRKLFQVKPVDVRAVQYGKTDTKRAIGNVLASVLKSYAYTSLSELNAVLNLYNITADRGIEGSRTHQKGGLFYRLLDEKGEKVGIPIKASLFYNKPGLKYLESRFVINKTRRKEHQLRLKSAIDRALYLRQRPSLPGLLSELKKQGIDTVIRANTEGRIYGITFVDHVRKTVFNGSDIDKNYSAAGIIAHLVKAAREDQQSTRQLLIRDSSNALLNTDTDTQATTEGLLETLMSPEYINQYTPYYGVTKRKKRKRKRI